MSSTLPQCSSYCTHQENDYSCAHYRGQGANVLGSGSPSNNQPTVLEPPFSRAGIPSSPRHYATTSTFRPAAPNTTQPPHIILPSPIPRNDQAEVTLPNLRPEDPSAFAQDIGWAPSILERMGSLLASDPSFFAADIDFSLASTYEQALALPEPPQQRLPPPYQPAVTFNTTSAESFNSSFTSSNSSHLTPSTDTELFLGGLSTFGAEITDHILTPDSSFASVAMPSTTRRPRAASITIDSSPPVGKRRRISDTGRVKLNPIRTPKVEGSFAADAADGFDTEENAPFMIDLTGTNNELADDPVDAPPPPKEEDKRVKLSAFQCVICMDDASSLTLTHCGHMYCAQCLHSSLNVEATRGKCPMCRQKIEMKPRDKYSCKTKGFWPLELKLMTSTRKGKRKAGNMS